MELRDGKFKLIVRSSATLSEQAKKESLWRGTVIVWDDFRREPAEIYRSGKLADYGDYELLVALAIERGIVK